jgi:hypothetical protein
MRGAALERVPLLRRQLAVTEVAFLLAHGVPVIVMAIADRLYGRRSIT